MAKKRFEFVMDEFSDKKIIEWLDKQANKGQYIRNLILQDLKKRAK